MIKIFRRHNGWQWLLLSLSVLTTGLIFYFSAQTGQQSSETSLGVMRLFQELFPFLELTGDKAHLVIRKLAHFTIFFLDGAFLTAYIRYTYEKRLMNAAFYLLIPFVSAIASEIEQIFIDGRGPSVMDVAIDSTGAAAGALFASVIFYSVMRFRERKQKVGGDTHV